MTGLIGRLVFKAALSLVLAASALTAKESSVTSEFGVASKYVFRGLELAETVVHPSLEFGWGDFYAGIWAAIPLEGRDAPDDFADEYDFYAGYGLALTDKLALDLGATRYYYPDGGSTTEAYVGLAAELGTFSPSAYLYNDFDLDVWTFELSSGVALPLEGFPIEASFFLGRSEDEGSGYLYYGVDLSYPVEVQGVGNVTFGLSFSDHDLDSGFKGRHLFGGVALSF